MNTKTLTKKLCIAGILCLISVLFYSQAFAWGGGSRRGDRGDRGNRGWNRSYHQNYDRFDRSGFFGFSIGNVIVRLPVGCQTQGAYYEKCPRGYIIIPECRR